MHKFRNVLINVLSVISVVTGASLVKRTSSTTSLTPLKLPWLQPTEWNTISYKSVQTYGSIDSNIEKQSFGQEII
jgi:hypothetical protein